MTTQDWRHFAACRNEEPDLFHPAGNSNEAAAQAEEAVAVCRRCPVVDQCLRYALDHGIREGIFGGLTGPERRRTHRRRTTAA